MKQTQATTRNEQTPVENFKMVTKMTKRAQLILLNLEKENLHQILSKKKNKKTIGQGLGGFKPTRSSFKTPASTRMMKVPSAPVKKPQEKSIIPSKAVCRKLNFDWTWQSEAGRMTSALNLTRFYAFHKTLVLFRTTTSSKKRSLWQIFWEILTFLTLSFKRNAITAYLRGLLICLTNRVAKN